MCEGHWRETGKIRKEERDLAMWLVADDASVGGACRRIEVVGTHWGVALAEHARVGGGVGDVIATLIIPSGIW